MEYLNLYDVNGNLLKEIGLRGVETDKYKGVSTIYIQNSKGEFLIQKTSKERNSIYATTGGHVSYGSDFKKTIIKEVREELGLDISKDEFKEVYSYIFDYYYQKVYYLKKDIDINNLTIQKEEVEYVQWFNKETIEKLINSNVFRKGNIEGYRYIINNL